MTVIVDGKSLAGKIQNRLKEYTTKLETPITFHIVYVGNDSVIDNFIRYKEKFGVALGVEVTVHRFDETILFEELASQVQVLQKDAHGMIIQLPLPDHLRVQSVLDLIPTNKDVDMLSTDMRRRFFEGGTSCLPPVAGSIIEILKFNEISLTNKKILLIGKGPLVGYPMSLWLERSGYSYDVVVKETDEAIKNKLIAEADIIISGAGVPNMIKPHMIKEGVVLIDAGTSESGKKIIGDIDPESYSKASLVTPVPGGIGPMTIAILYQNIIQLHKEHNA